MDEVTDSGAGEAVETQSEESQEEVVTENPVAPVKKYKVKVDGQETEVDEATLLSDYQLAKASHARMQQAAEAKKQAEEQIAEIRSLAERTRQDPIHLFKALGLDARAFAEALLTKEIENDLMTPEERELRELRMMKSKWEKENSDLEEAKKKKEIEALTEQAGLEIESEIVEALTASGIKPTPRTVARVAELMDASLDGDGPMMTAANALKRLKGEYRSDVTELLENLDPETLEAEYPSLFKKILKHASSKQSQVPVFQKGTGTKQKTTPSRPKTWEELMKD